MGIQVQLANWQGFYYTFILDIVDNMPSTSSVTINFRVILYCDFPANATLCRLIIARL